MKRAFLFGFFLFSTTLLFAQQVQLPTENGKVIYKGVVEASGLTQAQLYANAKKWIIDNYIGAENIIQSEDEINGQIIGKGLIPEYWVINKLAPAVSTKLLFTIRIDVKDNKYRFAFKDFTVSYTAANGQNLIPLEEFMTVKKTETYVTNIDTKINQQIESLDKALKNGKLDKW